MMGDVFDEARAERARAHAKHGDISMESMPADDPTGRRYRILVEEIGEVAQEFNDAEHERRPVDLVALRKELIQVAAMAGAWADACGPAPSPLTTEQALAASEALLATKPAEPVVDLMAALERLVAEAKAARQRQGGA